MEQTLATYVLVQVILCTTRYLYRHYISAIKNVFITHVYILHCYSYFNSIFMRIYKIHTYMFLFPQHVQSNFGVQEMSY